MSPKSKRSVVVLQPADPGFTRVDAVKIHRVEKILRHSARRESPSSLCTDALRSTHTEAPWLCYTVLQAIFVSRLSCASPAWWRFASMSDRNRLESFLCRSVRLGYHSNDETLAEICVQDDNRLFDNIIIRGDRHLICPIFPQERSQNYSMRKRCHNFQLPSRSFALCDSNFVTRMLYKDTNRSVQSFANF